MGLFKTLGFGAKEAGPSKEAEAQTPKPEAEKSAAEVGRERVKALREGAMGLWARMKERARSVRDAVSHRAKEAYAVALKAGAKGKEVAIESAFAAVGGVEKGAKKTLEAGKAAAEYTLETGREGWDLTKLAAEATKDAAVRVKDAAIDAGYTGAALAFMSGEKAVATAQALKERGIELGSAAGKKTVEAAAALAAMGVDAAAAIRDFGAEQIDKAVEAAKEAKEAGIDLARRGGVYALMSLFLAREAGIAVKDAVKGAAGEALDKGRELVGAAQEQIEALRNRAKEARDGFLARISTARDRFSSRLKTTVLEALRPEIDQMIRAKAEQLLAEREQLSRPDIAFDDDDRIVVAQ